MWFNTYARAYLRRIYSVCHIWFGFMAKMDSQGVLFSP